jgi:glycosyltransferase involved in cell wall biosynthesis
MDYALIGYPLSDQFRDQFEKVTASVPHYLGLPELRRMSLPRLIKTLAGLKADRLFIALESNSGATLLPVFYCFAALMRARQIQLVHPDLRCEAISRWRTLCSPASVLTATIDGQFKLRRCQRDVAALNKLPRIAVQSPTSGRVLFVKSNLWIGVKAGGSVGHIAGVVNGLVKHGYPIDFVANERPLMVDPSVNFHAVPPPVTYGVPYESNLYRYQYAIDRQLQSITADNSYHFIYQRMSVSNYSGVVLSRLQKLPLVLEYNGSEAWTSANWGTPPNNLKLAQACEDACLRHAHLIVTVSDVLRDELIDRGVDAHRVVSYPNCIDPQTFRPERYSNEHRADLLRKWGIPDDAVVAAFVGTFGQWHGVEILAEAIRRLVLEHGDWLRQSKVHFLVVGDGLGMPAVRQILADKRCSPFYTLTGLVPQAEAPAYMAAAQVLLSPHVENQDGSRFFGSPTKLFEYMAMGKAIIASDLEQIGEVLKVSLRSEALPSHDADPNLRQFLSILCRPGDVDSLLRGIRFLVEYPSWRHVLGNNARNEALTKYTWDRHVAAIIDRLSVI